MAANDIEYYNGQPIQMYKVVPTTDDIADGMTAWSTTAYHKRLGSCYFVDADYCHPVKEDTDRFTLQFKAATTGSNLFSAPFSPIVGGINTSVTTDFLIDSGATFITDQMQLNYLVTNTTTNTSSFVIDLTSETSLELEDDIFLATPNGYNGYAIELLGLWTYHEANDYFSITNPGINATLTFPTIVGIGNWYKMTITLQSVTAGSVTVKFGTTEVATLSSNGTHIIYGECAGNTDLVIETSTNFTGQIQGGANIDLRELVTDYSIVFFDLDGTAIDAYNYTETDNCLTIGNVFINLPWSTFNLACGKYVIGITEGTVCGSDMIVNGDFANGDSGWTLGGPQVVNEQLEFVDDAIYSYATNTLNCPIVEGHSYTVTWKVYNVSDPMQTTEGSYGVGVNITQVSPSYNPALQVGQTISLTFTAPESFCCLSFGTLSANNTFAIDDVTLVDNTIAIESEMDGLSECYCVCDPTCTVLIKYYSTRPTFGNYFLAGSKDYMYFRIYGRLRNANNSDLELNSFKTTMDNQIQPYLNMNRVEELATQPVPEWVHQSLSVALSHSEVLIDGVRYDRIGGYTPNFGDGELSDVVVNMARHNQANLRNNY